MDALTLEMANKKSRKGLRRRRPKPIRRLLGLLILAVLIYVLYQSLNNSPTANIQPHAANGQLSAFFALTYANNPKEAELNKDNIDKHLVNWISESHRSLDIASHDLNSEPITSAIIKAKQRGVSVRVVAETDYTHRPDYNRLIKVDIPVIFDGRSALMHNKFMVRDESAVWTGSYNFTDNGAYKNSNNALAIQNAQLAANYSAEFNEMFVDKSFGARSDSQIPYPKIILEDGTIIETLFAPENEVESHIISYLNGVNTSVHFMAFSFTSDLIGQKLLELSKRSKVLVEGVFEEAQSGNNYSEYNRLKEAGLAVCQDHNTYNMHHKVLILDKKIIITGSYNFSKNASESNDENILFITSSSLAMQYYKEFERQNTVNFIDRAIGLFSNLIKN